MFGHDMFGPVMPVILFCIFADDEGGGDWAGGCANQIKGGGDREGGTRKKRER